MHPLVRCHRATLAATLLAATLPAIPAARAQDTPLQPVSVRAVAHFGFDRAQIDPADRARILAEVAAMRDVTWQTVTATGHTDNVGASAYNERLAKRRALAVKNYLVGKGLMPEMISVEGKAAEAPLARNDSDAGRAQNRRAEIEFRGVRAQPPR